MKLLTCPLNGPRNISEFACAGELVESPDPRTLSDEAWADQLFLANNTAGVVREWWYHTPTAYWFIAERDTLTDEILKTYPASEVFSQRVEFDAPGAGDNP
jgi:sarcosine oxidase subunit delta